MKTEKVGILTVCPDGNSTGREALKMNIRRKIIIKTGEEGIRACKICQKAIDRHLVVQVINFLGLASYDRVYLSASMKDLIRRFSSNKSELDYILCPRKVAEKYAELLESSCKLSHHAGKDYVILFKERKSRGGVF